jgi:putative hydrolase of the HAD superfamily
MDRYGVAPDRFLMAGNSLRSDVLPVIEAGGHAVHVPYAISWVHERVPAEALADLHFHEIAHIRDLPRLIASLGEA